METRFRKASEVLEQAASLIEAPGAWTRRAFSRRSPDEPDDDRRWVPPEEARCFCALGAIAQVLGGDPDTLRVWDTVEASFLHEIVRHRAYSIPDFNDNPKRTQAEVVEALRRAADLARQDETGSRPPSPTPATEA